MYKIGELSKLSKLTVKTIRYYDSVGILAPDYIDRFTGYRYYSAAKLGVCNRIAALKELGFSLEEIRLHLDADSAEDIAALIDRKSEELRMTVGEAEERLRRLGTFRNIIVKGELKMFDMVIKKADSINVAYKREVFASKKDAVEALAEMKSALPDKIDGQRTVIINYETNYRENDLDLGICAEIYGRIPKDCGYTERTLAFLGDTASVICRSEELEDAYSSLLKQLNDLPAQIIGAFYEIGYDDGTVELKVPVYIIPKEDAQKKQPALIPFENDPEALGKWKLLDVVPSEEQFLYGHKKFGHDVFLNELYFFENGEPYWSISGWTKGTIQFKSRSNCKYTIKTVDSHRLLFLEMCYPSENLLPLFWVYEKESDKVWKKEEIRRCDNIDLPFVDDESVHGRWVTVDFCQRAEDFDPKKLNRSKEQLFLKSLTFNENGVLIFRTEHDNTLKWTKGFVLNRSSGTASAYEIRSLGGREYMFYEWKSGDYVYGNPPHIYLYILTRE